MKESELVEKLVKDLRERGIIALNLRQGTFDMLVRAISYRDGLRER